MKKLKIFKFIYIALLFSTIVSGCSQTINNLLLSLRRDFQRYPKLSRMEEITTEKVTQVLTDFNVQVQAIDDMTRALGLIKGRNIKSFHG